MVSAKRAVEAVPAPAQGTDIKPLYLEALTLVERSVFLWLAVLIVLALLGVSFDV